MYLKFGHLSCGTSLTTVKSFIPLPLRDEKKKKSPTLANHLSQVAGVTESLAQPNFALSPKFPFGCCMINARNKIFWYVIFKCSFPITSPSHLTFLLFTPSQRLKHKIYHKGPHQIINTSPRRIKGP